MSEMSHSPSVDQLTLDENDNVEISQMLWNHSHSEEFVSNKSHDSSFDINNYNTDDLEDAVSESGSNSDLDMLENVQSKSYTATPHGVDSNNNSIGNEEEFYQPLPPPKELDPDKLYALYAFTGSDPSYCQLTQDEDCILLNDEDAYWWLVKRCKDGIIGFAPAELLETFCERLARLNSWKNEQALLNLIRYGPNHQQLKNYKNGNKSVSFSEVVSYANDTLSSVQVKSVLEDLDNDYDDDDDDDEDDDDDDEDKEEDIIKPLKFSVFPESTSQSSSQSSSDKYLLQSSASIGNCKTDSQSLSSLLTEPSNTKNDSLHPYIAHLYTPVFTQVDDLLGKLNTWIT